jgi:DNA-binding SARP family transcriptional activator
MEFRILGPLEVVDGERRLSLGGPRQRTLLAVLLTRANEAVSVDFLADALWGEQPPKDAANALQYHVSQLRKLLGPDRIVTQGFGYAVRVAMDELDLFRFEQLVSDAADTTPRRAAELLGEALDLWRGPPLSDLRDETFAVAEVHRLEELRLVALERRAEAEVALGRQTDVIPGLEALVREHPLREPLRAALMRALYSAGRQADALEVYRETRELLVSELGIEPGPPLQALERAVLRQDPALAPEVLATRPDRAILVVADDASQVDNLLAIAEPLARQPPRELILARLLPEDGDLATANAQLVEQRARLVGRGVPCRTAVYTTAEPGTEAALLASEQDVDLVLVDASPKLVESGRPDDFLKALLDHVPSDVGIVTGRSGLPTDGPIAVPFGGVEHDWSAIELAAWLAASLRTTLRLLGTEADESRGRRDASRLLARGSLLVQQVVGVATEPVLVPGGDKGVVEATRDARILVVGLSDRWRHEGLGHARVAVAATAAAPVMFVRRGLRPGGIAPSETLTRFTWTLASEHSNPS